MIRIAVLLLSVVFLSEEVQAQAYPARSVKIIVPFGVGGPADLYARFVGARLSDAMGQPFVVENRPGAGAVVGSDAVAKSAPDGYTLLMMSNTHTVNETLIPKKPYALMKDLAPINGVNYSDLLMVVHPSLQSGNLRELLAQAKAHPGKLNYASSGIGTPYHMAGELFKVMAGADIVHVPYKGSDGARTGILSGQVHMMIDAITTMAPNVRAGKLRAIGTTGAKRSTVLPDVPTLAEAGLPGYETGIWLGLMAPAGTPRAVLERLNAETAKVLNAADVRKTWSEQGAVPMSMSIEQFDKFLREDIAKWARVIQATGIKAE
jgi:tripartite-type tricarboxylate transporter receptor subunit TctC